MLTTEKPTLSTLADIRARMCDALEDDDLDLGRGPSLASCASALEEMLALADLLKWCAAGEAADVRSRLRGVASRLASSKEELAGVIGEGAL